MKDFTIVVPCWNSPEMTGDSLMHICSLSEQANILLVDNHSLFPGTSDHLQQLAHETNNVNYIRPHH